MAFSASRLKLLRQRAGSSIRELSEETGIAVRTLSAYEGGAEPGSDFVEILSRHFRVPKAYFERPDLELLESPSVNFRKLSKTSARARDMALSRATMTLEFGSWVESRYWLPENDVPELDGVDPETAAEVVRTEWNLGARPIGNMIHLVESRGIRVFSTGRDCAGVDAFSFSIDGLAYIFVEPTKSGERRRFDVAHELGHLVLHGRGSLGPSESRRREMEADRFASSFLMPEDAILGQSLSAASVPTLLAAKAYWKVSAMALAHRLHSLGLYSDWVYRSTCIELSQRGYRRNEPGGIPPEGSQVLRKVLYGPERLMSLPQVARELDLNPDYLRAVTEGLLPAAVS